MDKRITKYQSSPEELVEYKNCISSFGEAMLKELIDNHDKGGRCCTERGWLITPIKQLLGEVYYHTGKLQEAIRNNDPDLTLEYSADVANLALMIYDKVQHLAPISNKLT